MKRQLPHYDKRKNNLRSTETMKVWALANVALALKVIKRNMNSKEEKQNNLNKSWAKSGESSLTCKGKASYSWWERNPGWMKRQRWKNNNNIFKYKSDRWQVSSRKRREKWFRRKKTTTWNINKFNKKSDKSSISNLMNKFLFGRRKWRSK